MDLKSLLKKTSGEGKLTEKDLENVKFPMRGEGGKFIGKETFLDLPAEEQKKLLEESEPVEQVRGPGGKFISKEEKKQEKNKEDKEEKEAEEEKTGKKPKIETVKVEGYGVRKFIYDGQTYYCVEDVFAAAKIESPKKYLGKLSDGNSEVTPLIESFAEAEIKKEGKNEVLRFATKGQIFALQKSMKEKLSGKVLSFLHQ